ncbi:MAG TPA: ornithine carbamoyltransferase [Chloroflexota bacterium]|nr:ornithine carbamoyltransferase [Chloroflexota bacterium]
MKHADFLSLRDVPAEIVHRLLERALALKTEREIRRDLFGKSLALVFQKPSLRTRGSFDVAMQELGGHLVYFGPDEVGLGKRESIPDVGRVLSEYVQAIAARTYRHEDVETLARYASVPVINALSDFCHPCQAMADLLTLREHFGALPGITLTYVGDGNNVCHALLFGCSRVGIHLRVASPVGYEPREQVIACARQEAARHGGSVTIFTDPREAARGADALYTDVWTSMGQEEEAVRRRRVFAEYRLDQALLGLAHPEAIVLHDLPAHRGEEITDEVIDGPQSVVFQQAGNRLHAQKAILLWLMTNDVEAGLGT